MTDQQSGHEFDRPASGATTGANRAPGFVTQFFMGLSGAADGFRYLCRYPSLWQYGVAPVIVNVIVSLVVWLLSFQLCRAVWLEMAREPSDAWWAGMLHIVAMIAFVLVAVAVAIISYLLLQSIFCTWFFSRLARRVELHLGVADKELCDISIAAQVRDALRAVFKLIVLNVALLFLHLVPGVGSVAAVALGLYFDSFILGSEFLGYPLELRGQRWLARQQFAKACLGTTVGLGAVVSLLMLVPFMGAVFQTTAVVGAVLLRRRLLNLPIDPPGARMEL